LTVDSVNCAGRILVVAPNIEATIKKSKRKKQISGILFLDGKMSCLMSRHLVLWSLGTLTGQQRFYGTELVVARECINTPSASYLR
jgi:hypothetical protein